MNVKERVELLCRQRGMSVKELESTLGFGKSTIVKWDVASPRVDKLAEVAKYFNVTLDWLFYGEEKTAPRTKNSAEINIIARAGRKMSQEDRVRMVKLLKLAFPEAF